MRAVYFASVRERVGITEEEIDPPENVVDVAQLIDWLASRGEGYAEAFANKTAIRAAIDKNHARRDSLIASAREVAFFPPMTGG